MRFPSRPFPDRRRAVAGVGACVRARTDAVACVRRVASSVSKTRSSIRTSGSASSAPMRTACCSTRPRSTPRTRAMRAQDPTIHDLSALPATITAQQAREWIEDMSERPTRTLYDEKHQVVPAATLDGLVDALALDKLAASTPTRYGLVVRTRLAAHVPDDAARVLQRRRHRHRPLPGKRAVPRHAGRDRARKPRRAMAVRRQPALRAPGSRRSASPKATRDVVLGYAARARPTASSPARRSRTVYTPEAPRVSELQLDMGVRLPLRRTPRPTSRSTASIPIPSWIVDLPVRERERRAAHSRPRCCRSNADTAADYLPLTRANLIRQAFKFLGERYGWGHAYNGRDCSGFVSEVYRSMGVLTAAQHQRPGGAARRCTRTLFDDTSDARAARRRRSTTLEVGDLVYIPGHVMMVIGRDRRPALRHPRHQRRQLPRRRRQAALAAPQRASR